jgi:hypothetical protein
MGAESVYGEQFRITIKVDVARVVGSARWTEHGSTLKRQITCQNEARYCTWCNGLEARIKWLDRGCRFDLDQVCHMTATDGTL